MAMPLTHRRFTVDEYHRMVEAGILTEDDRVELLDGEIVEMSPIGDRHVACVVRLNALLAGRLGERFPVSVQNPFILADRSEPEPDIVVLGGPKDLRGAWIPQREEALLVVEVADTSLRRDRETKVPLYGREGVREVWLVNLPEDRVEVFRDPRPQGYRSVRHAVRGEMLSPLLLPGFEISVADVLG